MDSRPRLHEGRLFERATEEGMGPRPPVFTGAGSRREDNGRGRGLGDPAGGGAVAFFDFDADGEVVFELFQVGDDDDALEVLLKGG